MKTVECEIDVANFTKSFKSIGYNHYSAILDLIDNAVSAGASKIWVDYYGEKKGSYRIVIADNGCGMEREELIDAIRIASADPTTSRQQKDLGKFGLGMKLASFSQTDKFSVVSKMNGKDLCAFTWDLEFVRQKKKWLLQEEELNFVRPKNQGTEVILYGVFKGVEINDDQVFAKVRTHIAVAYSMMKGIQFYINEKEIEPIDPFFSESIASNHSSLENLNIEDVFLAIQSHQIPHFSKQKPKEKRVYTELTEIGMGPGLYIYRKNRLIAWSGWEGLGKNLRINDLFRMAVFCQDDADELFNIEVKKSQISVTDIRLRNLLKSSIMHFSEIARKPYKKRAQLSLRDLTDIWYLEKNKDSDKVLFSINRKSDAIKQLEQGKLKLSDFLKIIENTMPYESLLYYLNLNKVDNNTLDLKKLETAKMMLEMALLTENEYKKIQEKYGC
jgi:hypothetical protein